MGDKPVAGTVDQGASTSCIMCVLIFIIIILYN